MVTKKVTCRDTINALRETFDNLTAQAAGLIEERQRVAQVLAQDLCPFVVGDRFTTTERAANFGDRLQPGWVFQVVKVFPVGAVSNKSHLVTWGLHAKRILADGHSLSQKHFSFWHGKRLRKVEQKGGGAR